ncbi:MAG: hypothetical protein KDD14_25265, partial [Saprospiraceae bacterium]|nr:hypothetical protein [Saprospiraceae bacterium]
AVQRVAGLNPAGVSEIARLHEIQQEFGLTFEEAIALQGEIPNTKLYTRVVHNAFFNFSVNEPVPGMLDKLFDPAKLGIEANPIPPVQMDVETLTDNGQLPYLLKGLGVSEADYQRVYGLLFGATTPVLNLKNVSDCYRFIRLAKALGLSVEALGYLLRLDNGTLAFNLERSLQLIPLAEKVKSMPLSLHELWFIARDDNANTGNSKIQSAYAGVDESGKSLALIAAENWTASWLADERLYISPAILRAYLPTEYSEDAIKIFIQALADNKVLMPATDSGCRVTSPAKLQIGKIPKTLTLDKLVPILDANSKPKIDPVTNLPKTQNLQIELKDELRQELADFLNLNYIEDANKRSVRELSVREHIARAFGMDTAFVPSMANWYSAYSKVVEEAVQNLSNSDGVFAPADLADLSALFPQFERVALLFKKLGFDLEDALAIDAHRSHFFEAGKTSNYLVGVNTLTEIFRISDFIHYKPLAGAAITSSDYRNTMLRLQSAWIHDKKLLNVISELLNCEPGQILAIDKLVPLNMRSKFPTEALNDIKSALDICTKLGIYESSTLEALKKCHFSHALQYEPDLYAAFRARYTSEDAFEKAFEPLEERINELRRDVLCAFLLALYRDNRFLDAGDLYAYFLVDVEMSGCAKVSEILAGTLTLQLYIHRVLMGLEISVDLNTEDEANPAVRAVLIESNKDQENPRMQWEWRKNYRVWEANRKVFLYPENWIEPELRDDKSPLFKTLEDELLQQKITLESAEGAYKEYFKGFAQIGRLIISGIHFEENVYHIFARSSEDPYQYYYR